MGTSVVPGLIDALVAAFDGNVGVGVNVYDATPVTDDPELSGYVMVGVEDPYNEDFDVSADVTQEVTTLATTRPRHESGEIPVVVMFWDGDGIMKTARDGVYAITAAIETIIRTAGNPTPFFNVTGVYAMYFGPSSQLYQMQAEDGGAIAYLTFRIAFDAKI